MMRVSPVRLGVVCAELLPEDSVSAWRGQKVALPLCPTSQLHLLHLNGHLYNKGQCSLVTAASLHD